MNKKEENKRLKSDCANKKANYYTNGHFYSCEWTWMLKAHFVRLLFFCIREIEKSSAECKWKLSKLFFLLTKTAMNHTVHTAVEKRLTIERRIWIYNQICYRLMHFGKFTSNLSASKYVFRANKLNQPIFFLGKKEFKKKHLDLIYFLRVSRDWQSFIEHVWIESR